MAAGKGMRDVALTEKRYRPEDKNYKKVKVYPRLVLELRDVPELKNKKFDQECMLLVKAKVLTIGAVNHYAPEGEKPEPKIELEIRSVKPYAGGNPGKGEPDYEPKKDGY